MGKTWQIQEAKNRLSEVIDRALEEGPQMISRRGEPVAIVVSVDEWKRRVQPKTTLVDFFRKSPLVEADLDLHRGDDTGRDIDL